MNILLKRKYSINESVPEQFKSMPFSLFAARCLYVAKQTPKYRRDVIRRVFNARVAAHTALFTFAGAPVVVDKIMPSATLQTFDPETFQK